jgi:hypothetical protein
MLLRVVDEDRAVGVCRAEEGVQSVHWSEVRCKTWVAEGRELQARN